MILCDQAATSSSRNVRSAAWKRGRSKDGIFSRRQIRAFAAAENLYRPELLQLGDTQRLDACRMRSNSTPASNRNEKSRSTAGKRETGW